MESCPATGSLFGEQKERHAAQQGSGELCCRHAVTQRKPGTIDAGGEGRHAKVGHRAVISQGLHQRQRDAGHHTGPRQRQGDAEKAAPRPAAKGSRRFMHAAGRFKKGRAREEIDVGVEHKNEHRHRTAQTAHVRKPVIGPAPAEAFAQGTLQGPGKLQEIGINIGQHIGRCRQWQEQRPLKKASAGKFVHDHQPGRRHANGERTGSNAQTQPERAGQIFRQHRRRQMRPHR